ncbi:MAG: metallophosphoesterase [Clostridia bacterium]|nr:metallophosphoesterase [Clostridia bacterium]
MKSRDPIFAKPRKKHRFLSALVVVLLFLCITTVAFNYINNVRVTLIKQSVTIPTLPKQAENFRILHISDLHGISFGPGQSRLKDTLKDAKYNIVCFTGDAVDKDGNFDAFLELIALFPDTPFYFISGDEDPSPIIATPHEGDSPKAQYIQAAEAMGAVYLDAPVKISDGTDSVWLSPERVYSLDAHGTAQALSDRREELMKEADSPEKKAALEAVSYQEEQLERIRLARKEMLPGDTHIALSHHPLTKTGMTNLVEFLKTDNESYVSAVALLLSGHYVGGQWRIPLLGPVKAPASSGLGNNGWFPDDTFVSGLSYTLGIAQYISPGLGTSQAMGLPPIRLFNTPAVTQITLTTKMTY